MFLAHSRRQVFINPNPSSEDTGSSLFYWHEWAVFAGALLLLVISIGLLRYDGKKRIASQRKLLPIQKYFFPRIYRNGPPYADPPVPLTSTYEQFRRTFGNSVAAPPPSYDPYAQNLPAYQAKTDETHVGTSEVPLCGGGGGGGGGESAVHLDAPLSSPSPPLPDDMYRYPIPPRT